ncbi:MAG TPA: hypothetical protein VEQ60_06745 [Longimicrobium sp.]|nr:hypothetical protein [Longimicrobium sp.]
MVYEIAHQVKPDGELRGASVDDGIPEKTRMAPCRASIPLPFPMSQGSLMRAATADVRDTGGARGDSPRFQGMRGVQADPE